MTALGGEIVDYSELDVAGLTEWQLGPADAAAVIAFVNHAVLSLCALIAPGFTPEPLDVAALGVMARAVPPSPGSAPDPGLTGAATPTSG